MAGAHDGARLHRWLRRGAAVDQVVVAAVVAIDLVGMVIVTAGGDLRSSPGLGGLGVGLAVVDGGLLWWRRRRPLLVLAGVVLWIGVVAEVGEPGLLAQRSGLVVVLAVYAVGAWSDRRRWSLVAVALLVALVAVGAEEDGASLPDAVAAGLTVGALPYAVGAAARARRRYTDEVERRLVEAERRRDERARRAVLDERTHIARELHDLVAHHVSLIGVQAGAARTTLDGPAPDPDRLRDALVAIERSSREAVQEMRHLLDALRDEGSASLAPQPGLADVDRLVAGFRAAGLDVTVERPGPAPDLPPVLDLTCYRIVEEALTNVARHSGAGRATVTLAVTGDGDGNSDGDGGDSDGKRDGKRGDGDGDSDGVRVTIRDAGPARAGSAPGEGRGLVGMAERVALFGGELAVGPAAGGGFVVDARLPGVAR